MATRSVFWVDELAVANIDDTEDRIVFALRDDDGTHLTVWRDSAAFRFECSSALPLGSVWDEARKGIARDGLGYTNWQKHANYLVNRPLDHFADSTTPIVTFSMPRAIKPVRASHRASPAIGIASPAPDYDLSLYFSPSRSVVIPRSVGFDGQIGRLIMSLTKRSSERSPGACLHFK